jgi:hypothetical protein
MIGGSSAAVTAILLISLPGAAVGILTRADGNPAYGPCSVNEPPPELYGTTITGVPAGARRKIRRISLFETRMQPCEAARPIDHGSFVP